MTWSFLQPSSSGSTTSGFDGHRDALFVDDEFDDEEAEAKEARVPLLVEDDPEEESAEEVLAFLVSLSSLASSRALSLVEANETEEDDEGDPSSLTQRSTIIAEGVPALALGGGLNKAEVDNKVESSSLRQRSITIAEVGAFLWGSTSEAAVAA